MRVRLSLLYATLLQLNGVAGEFHDFPFSPVLGGEFKRQAS
jgi:hypothetical protein